MSYQSTDPLGNVGGLEVVHTLAREWVDDLFLDTLLTLGQSLVLHDRVN
jgi:hypothetical protein